MFLMMNRRRPENITASILCAWILCLKINLKVKFDETYWLKAIKQPTWYIELYELVQKIKSKHKDQEQTDKLNKQIRHFFEKELAAGNVALGSDGYDFDQEREAIDTVVIHHTSHTPGYRLDYLNAVHLLNIYVPVYTKGQAKGQPIWSGHFKKTKQVFWGYHWLMRMDGKFEHLLLDNEIGWHAGNWDINKRSIGVCLDNDFEKQDPADHVLKKLAEFINDHYPNTQIIGHCEAAKTICPGNHFIDTWKPKLLNYL